MKTTSKTNSDVFTRIENSKGRFFGLYLKNGDVLNAQYRGSTNSYLTIYDRNTKMVRKIRKTSVGNATV